MQAVAFQLPAWEALPDLGLYMDQVITYLERQCRPGLEEARRLITPAMINNYVKGGVIDRPQKKKYGRVQLAQLLMLCALKQALSLEDMKRLLSAGEDDVRVRYVSFAQQYAQTAQALAEKRTGLTPLACAVTAAAYQRLAHEMLCGDAPSENP